MTQTRSWMCLRAIWSDEDEVDDDDDGGGEVRARLDQCERSLDAAFPPRDGEKVRTFTTSSL